MASGGARSRSGPAPDPNALRRNRDKDGDWLLLPAEGRPGAPPAWPMPTFTDREVEVWASLWSLPQAVAWDRDHMADHVALYCRRWCEAEEPNSSVALSTLVRQLRDDLGLTTDSMLRKRWKFAADETASRRADRSVVPRSSSKDRLKVVGSDGDA